MVKKLCFVLGSGGARGISHIGFLQAMDENGIKPDCIVGCSMGALVGACYSVGITPLEMKTLAENLKSSELIDFDLFPFTKKSIMRSMKMRNKITSLLGGKTFEDLKIPFKCVAVDILTGKIVTLEKGNLADAVTASSAIPTIFKPVVIDGMELIDGGIVMRVPVSVADDFKPDVVVAVDVIGKLKEYQHHKGIIYQLLKVVEVNDCYHTERYLKEHKPDLLICPELGDLSPYKVEKLSFAYEQGYKIGLEYVDEIKKLIQNKK